MQNSDNNKFTPNDKDWRNAGREEKHDVVLLLKDGTRLRVSAFVDAGPFKLTKQKTGPDVRMVWGELEFLLPFRFGIHCPDYWERWAGEPFQITVEGETRQIAEFGKMEIYQPVSGSHLEDQRSVDISSMQAFHKIFADLVKNWIPGTKIAAKRNRGNGRKFSARRH